jgi:catechol 2,3-dioxygenase-like lactoylglutathione lyase family enzyme
MAQAEISGISPFFIVSHVPSSLSFYRDRLGFEIAFQGPAPDDIFFGIVRRGGAQILLKAVWGRSSAELHERRQKRYRPLGRIR